jgi:shikimate kinase
MSQARHIVIAGLIGSGKTTLGRALAARLGRPYADSDAAIEARHGRTAREIADEEGLARLHGLEAEELIGAIGREEPSVVSAAASTIEDPAAREALEAPDVLVIWLRGTPTVLAQRASRGSHRPFREAETLDVLKDQTRRRDPLFAERADATIDVDERTPEKVLAVALDVVERASSSG